MPNSFFAFGKPAWQHEDHPPPSRPWSSPVIICPSPSYQLCSEPPPCRLWTPCAFKTSDQPNTRPPLPPAYTNTHSHSHTYSTAQLRHSSLSLFSFYSFNLNIVFVYSCCITLSFCVCLKMFLFFLRLLKYMCENNFCQVNRKVNTVAPRQNWFVRLQLDWNSERLPNTTVCICDIWYGHC